MLTIHLSHVFSRQTYEAAAAFIITFVAEKNGCKEVKSLSQGHAGRAGLSPGALFLCGRPGCRVRAAPPLSGLGSASYSWDVRGEFFTRTSGSRAPESLAPCDGVPGLALPCRAAVSTRPLPLPLLRPKPPFPAGISWLHTSLKSRATRPFKGA